MAATSPSTLSVTIGGRIVSPALPTVDASTSSVSEKSFDDILADFTNKNIPLESTEGIQRRERVLDRLRLLCREWIRSVSTKLLLPSEAVENVGGQLFTSGSYRLGIHEPGADIDTILVAPSLCTGEDFFGSGYVPPNYDGESDISNIRDPDSLAERIKRHPDVSNFVPVENAAVPILTFDWEGINIDLLFARLNTSSVPRNFDIDNDKVLDGVDSATEKSLNGPRVTNLIAALVNGTPAIPERYECFLKVVRCVRKWAKARGLYSNKMGYWGGVNINIAVALVIQLYPNACAASLLRKFFLVFKSWRWPNPVMLTKPHDANLGLTVWNAYRNPYQSHNLRQVAPVITPAYPAMNSTLSVSRQTLQILHEEFCRGHDILDKLWKRHLKKDEGLSSGDVFHELFQPADFFISYPYYISLCIVGPTVTDAQSWSGFVESRLRKLVSDILGKSLPLSKIQLWPKKIEACVADRTAPLTSAQRQNSITYFVGFIIDQLRMRGEQLNIEQQLQNFRSWELQKFQPFVNGMDVIVKNFNVKELPRICFEGTYEGGKLAAMKKRQQIRNADPKVHEARLATRLAELKEKMAKSSEIISNKNKRKREEVENDTNESKPVVKTEKDAQPIKEESKEEETLENALDRIQTEAGEGAKTREEAENDRQKLLSGELLGEGGESDQSDAEDGIVYGPERVYTSTNSTEKPLNLMSIAKQEIEILRNAGYNTVSDDDVFTIGGNLEHPWRRPVHKKVTKGESTKDQQSSERKTRMVIQFKTNFDVVELDSNGFVVDKGDEDFKPSKNWTGRAPGFEFKLGDRGLGYYRTGKKVSVPSNIAY